MPRTYSTNNKIYSVDMMFAFVYIFSPTIVEVDVDDYVSNLDYPMWGNPQTNDMYSPNDVLKNRKEEKYKNDLQRISGSNLSYPIIIHTSLNGDVDSDIIIDGIHRLSKAKLNKKERIKAYLFDDELMDKFLVDDNLDFDKIDKLEVYQYIALFNRRFYNFNQRITFGKYDRYEIIANNDELIKVKTRLDDLYRVCEPIDGKNGFEPPDFKSRHKLFVCYVNETVEAFMVLYSIDQYKNDDNFKDQGGLETGRGAMITSVCGNSMLKGHMRALMNIAKKYSKKKKFDYILIHVSKERPQLEKAYAKEGFKYAKDYVPDNSSETLHIMLYKI